MKILPVSDSAFDRYGRVLSDYDFRGLLETLERVSPLPEDHVVYVPGDDSLERLPVAEVLRDNIYGGLPIEVGYCNGSNHKLNCLEWHRGSEVNITANDMVLLLAPITKMRDGRIDSGDVEAFLVKAGVGVLLYETSLHYAPCNAAGSAGFRVIVVLPAGTNTEKPQIEALNQEDKLLFARNKWLTAHPESNEAKNGVFAGISGKNIVLP